MPGMSSTTGRTLDGMDHLRQSITDILTTPVGSRLQRRTYGSLLPELIDHPDNPTTRVRLYSATAGALMRWEPRFRVSGVRFYSGPLPGQASVEVSGVYLREGVERAIDLTVPLTAGLRP